MLNQHACIRMIVYFLRYGFFLSNYSMFFSSNKDQKLDPTDLKD
jgi:hypothetical protein